ncbi:amidase family protein [Pseudofrankia sp. BMG5.36]|uniref:amidase n=1 Tax=Pseudofrankia sp. BMG5.36 TaxID=1834512 RepID=UPI0008D9F0C3|nr:amidase family protein [Pseudofrankia sp. BMG5.36]OHV47420.1 amidase [Pseudofrankia sp. BMG5.36]
MDLHEYACHDAVGLRTLIAKGEVSAAEVEAAARKALGWANDRLNALAAPLFGPALSHDPQGPLGGVPFLIKDTGPMAEGVPFRCGSRSLGPGIPAPADHELMRRFRAAGLVTLGLTISPEMGLSFTTEPLLHGPVRNPWDPSRTVGGSSGGAAALVAAGAVPVAHANDGAGSIRVPASCCGLVGLKPSRGRTPTGAGLGAAAFGMLSEFALTRTVRDAAALLDAVHGPMAGGAFAAPPPARPYAREVRPDARAGGPSQGGGLRVAVTTRAWSGAGVDPEVAAATVHAGEALAALGHHVEEASPPLGWDEVIRACMIETVAMAAPFLLAPRQPPADRLEAVSRRVLAYAREHGAVDLVAGLDAAGRVGQVLDRFLAEHDLLVTPTLARLPVPHGTLRYDDPGHTVESWLREIFDFGPFTSVANVTGVPAVSLPLGQSAGDLPIGVQIIAAHGREDLLLRVSAALEEAMPWRDRRPPLSARRA